MPFVYNNATPPRKLYAQWRISTSEVLFRNLVYPNAVDDSEVVGLDPDLLYLAMDTDTVPEYDPRIFTLVPSEAKVGSTLKKTWTTPKRAVDQIKIAIENRERSEIAKHVTEYEREKLEILGLAVLFAINAGAVLTQRQTAIKNKINAAAAKLLQNDQTTADKFVQVDNNEVPDIDAGWAAPS